MALKPRACGCALVDDARITTRTYEYPGGTIVVDVVDARSDSLVWRGTAAGVLLI
jgi:hypothetical protein